MGTKKVSAMTELTTPAIGDYLLILDSSGLEDKKIKYQNAIIGVTSYTMTASQTTLTCGTHIGASPIEVVFLAAGAAETLQMINGSANGNIKIIIATGGNVSIVRNDTYIKTKNPTTDATLAMATGDVIVLANVGGDPDSSINGTWIEIARALQV